MLRAPLRVWPLRISALSLLAGSAAIFACVGDDPGNDPDGSTPVEDGGHDPPGRDGGNDAPSNEDASSCGHDLCVNFDTATWNDGWTKIETQEDGGASAVGITTLNAPPSKPSSLQTSVTSRGRAYIKAALPWALGNGTRAIRATVDVYIDRSESNGPVLAWSVDESNGEAQIITVSRKTDGEITIYENDNRPPAKTLTTCPAFGSIPAGKWTRLVVTLEGRTATVGGWLTLGIAGESPRKCDLASTDRPANIGLYVGLMSQTAGPRVAQYDDLFVDITP